MKSNDKDSSAKASLNPYIMTRDLIFCRKYDFVFDYWPPPDKNKHKDCKLVSCSGCGNLIICRRWCKPEEECNSCSVKFICWTNT